MTNPADELRAAAKTIREHATAAEADVDTNPYWQSALTERPDWYANGVRNGLGGPSGELAAVMGPGVAHALAQWLCATASYLDANTHPSWQETTAGLPLAVARAINGSAR